MNGVNLANSSETNKRRELDFYPTPPEVTHALMQFLQDKNLLNKNSMVWEPACGTGEMSEVIKSYGFKVSSSDLRDTGYGKGNINFLEVEVKNRPSAIITNPPFNISSEFIKKATANSNIVAMVLKSQYWHASKRTALFKQLPPAYVLALNWRPDFMGGERGGAPTMEVHWTVWIKGERDTRYRVIEKPKVIGI